MSTFLLGLLLFVASIAALGLGQALGAAPLSRGCGGEQDCARCKRRELEQRP